MRRFVNDSTFWEIDYIPDINEIIIHTGHINKKGVITMIYEGYDGDKGYQSMEVKINNKRSEKYTEVPAINNKYKLYDYYTTINKLI